MEKVLVLAFVDAEHSEKKTLAEAVTCAGELAGKIGTTWELALVGTDVQTAANSVADSCCGKIWAIEGEDFAQARYASDLLAAEALLKVSAATLVIAAGTSRANRILPALSMRVGGRADTHTTAVTATEKGVELSRWFYRMRIEATFTRPQRPWIIGLEPGSVAAKTWTDGIVTIEKVDFSLPENAKRTKVLDVKNTNQSAQGGNTIRPDAKTLFVAGAGWTKKQSDGQVHTKEAESIILGFLDKTKASLGSTKSLVDQSGEGNAVLSFMTHLNQVGQTGSTPRHAKGLATCCHGEEPHVVGWRFINERRVVNTDPNCGWARGKADVLYVADAFAVMKRVNELLSYQKEI